MYIPEIPHRSNGTPIVNGDELDIIGERLVADFSSDLLCMPQEIDIDRFVLRYLHMNQDFFYLSHNGIYLGMTVFRDTDRIPVYIPELGRAEYASSRANTVIIDESLTAENQEHRYRFTMGHEASHEILHPDYFLYRDVLGIPYAWNQPSYIKCRTDDYCIGHDKKIQVWTDPKRIEWQANRLSSAILMPRCSVRMLLAHFPDRGEANRAYIISKKVSETFNVSFDSAYYRLKDLNVIDKDTASPGIVRDFGDIPEYCS